MSGAPSLPLILPSITKHNRKDRTATPISRTPATKTAADAALIARALPGRPVRVQWMREQEHGWEPYGPAMVAKVSAAVDASGRIADWDYAVWSNTHSMRPCGAGSLIAAQSPSQPFAQPGPKPIPQPEGGGDRNAIPLYKGGRGRGFAFARYKNLAAYCAVAMEVEVARDTGRTRVLRAVAAVDAGQAVNPDGLINQIGGGTIQSISWTLYERVTFDDTRITSIDWSTYPILRFNAVPDSVAVHVLDRPGQPFLGSGEAAQGPAAAALANALASATGHRFRDLPLTRERIKAAVPV